MARVGSHGAVFPFCSFIHEPLMNAFVFLFDLFKRQNVLNPATGRELTGLWILSQRSVLLLSRMFNLCIYVLDGGRGIYYEILCRFGRFKGYERQLL